MGKDILSPPFSSESNLKKKPRFTIFGIGIGSVRDKDHIDNRLDSPRFSELMKTWYAEEKVLNSHQAAGRRVRTEDIQRMDRMRIEIISECRRILEKLNHPNSYRNLLETASCLYYEAARFRCYELIELAQHYERIAAHQLRLPSPSEDVRVLFKGLLKARALSQDLDSIVNGEAPFNQNIVERIAGELVTLYYSGDDNKLSPYDMGRARFDYSPEHIEFNTLSLGGWIIAQLILEAHSLGITDYSSYIRLRQRIKDFQKQ